ncbi:hypothetical protein MATL_G00223610 [Megalops atlanticus]|uniref:Uncharacterized protein n=1 Tax=Megalops atlanticus TaxID=7932 RepID=A0A9D3PGP2_MEGAT|nr:hypothetical protein MATL_G00223610 [Megalops atlanticus]
MLIDQVKHRVFGSLGLKHRGPAVSAEGGGAEFEETSELQLEGERGRRPGAFSSSSHPLPSLLRQESIPDLAGVLSTP